MKKEHIVLIIMLFVVLGQIPPFLRAMKEKQTARAWFTGFVLTLLAGCWIVYLVRSGVLN